MIDSFLLLAPLLLIPVVGLVCFVGCDKVFGLERVPDGPAPTGFTATPGDSQVVLSWDAYPNATGYTLQRGETSGSYGASFPIAADKTGHTDLNRVNGTTYYYRLKEDSSLPSEEVSATPSAAALVPFVTSFMPTFVQTTLTGWYGMELVVGANPIRVKGLGRAFAPGNSQIHVIKIVDAAGTDVPNGFTSVSMAGGVDGEIRYGPLATPVMLNPGSTYIIVCQETAGMDGFYNHDLMFQTTDAAVVQSAIKGGPPYIADNPGVHTYGPVSFQY